MQVGRNGYQLFRSEETANSKIRYKFRRGGIEPVDMHKNELIRWLESKICGTFLIHDDGTIDVDGDVNLEGKLGDLGELGDLGGGGNRFGKVTGNFNCQKNRLISLKGSPNEVGGKFDCSDNPLISLEGFPEIIRGGFFCKTANLDDFLGTNLPAHLQKFVPHEWWARHLELGEAKQKLTSKPKEEEVVMFDIF